MVPSSPATITINLAPSFELGPLTVTWHGITVVIGIIVAGALAGALADRRGLDRDKVLDLALATAIAGIVGARLFYLLLNDPGALLDPSEWLGSNGFAIYGGVFGGVAAAIAMIRWRRLSWRYLDVLALGFPLGLALGRVGDLINGEHYGPPSDLPWAVIHAHPDASVPSNDVAYHDGGLYEIVLGLAIFSIVWPLRDRFRVATSALWAVLGLYGAGRFVMFFYRSDSDAVALGINAAQIVSLVLIAIAIGGLWVASRRLSGADELGTDAVRIDS